MVNFPDRDIRCQLARPTRLLGFSLDIKSYIAVYVFSMLFVLFFLVMCIWIDLQVLKIRDFGSTLTSQQAEPSQAKPTAWEAYKGIPSQDRLQERMLNQSALGMKPRWIHLQQHPKVGTRYFFLSPLPLVRYLEIVLPLRAGPLFSKIFQSASAGPLFRYRYFFRSALAALPLVRYSATNFFNSAHL